MAKSFYISCLIIISCLLCLSCVAADDERETITKDALGLTIPNPFGKTPIFETNHQDGRYIGLHIPFLFEFQLTLRGGLDMKYTTSILHGLISFNYDRQKLADGERHGPIQLKVLGLTLYDNHEQPYA